MKNTLTFAFALLLVLLALNHHFTNQTIRELQHDQQQIAERQGLRIEVVALLKAFSEIEASEAMFLESGKEKDLALYRQSRTALESGSVRLRSVIAPEKEARELRERIRPPQEVKFAEAERLIALRRGPGLDPAGFEAARAKGRVAMETIRGVLQPFDDEQRERIFSLLKQTEKRRQHTAFFSSGAALVFGGAFIALFLYTMRNLNERERLLREGLEARDALESALTSERTAHSEATHANNLKDEFIAVVSHELRTPLNAILGWTSLLREGAENDTELHEGLDTIDRNAHAQARLVDDLLDISRIMTGKVRLHIEEVDLRTVAVAVVDGLRPAAEARGVKVKVSAEPRSGEVLGDRDRLQQIMWNLLGNAIKFTPRGGQVEVSLGHSESLVVLEVRDSGQGIRPDFLPRIFDRFSQQDTSITRGQAGLGLGLAITRHLVELHGGQISVSSAGENQGATFRVEIPIVAVRELKDQFAQRKDAHPSRTAHPHALPEGVLRGLRVLAVDDQPDTLTVIERVLSRAGAEVRVAPSVPEALSVLRHWPAELVVSDIGMPGKDGYSFVRELRDHPNPALRELRAVALTAFAREKDRQDALAAGFDDFITKPVNAGELVETLARVSGRA